VKELSPYAEDRAHDWDYYCVDPPLTHMQHVYLVGFVFTPTMREKHGMKNILYADEMSHAHVAFIQGHTLPNDYEQMLTNCSIFSPEEVHHLHTRSYLKKGAFAIFELM